MPEKAASGLLFLVAIIWGSGFVAMKQVLELGLQPFAILFFRFFIASLIMGLVLKAQKVRIHRHEWKAGAIIGVLLFLAFAFQTVGLQFTSVANNAFITGANVVMVPLLLFLFTKQPPKKERLVASVLCFLGIALLSFEGEATLRIGDFLTLICALFFALQIIAVQHFHQQSDRVLPLVFTQTFVACAFSFVGMVFEGVPASLSASGWGGILYLALFSTTLCFFLQNVGQKYTDASKAALILASESLFGAFFGWLIYQNAITIQWLMGCGFMMVAIFVSERKKGEEEE
ncbi:MAG: DMT family transporter [Erysipelotrichaceae bacterium]